MIAAVGSCYYKITSAVFVTACLRMLCSFHHSFDCLLWNFLMMKFDEIHVDNLVDITRY